MKNIQKSARIANKEVSLSDEVKLILKLTRAHEQRSYGDGAEDAEGATSRGRVDVVEPLLGSPWSLRACTSPLPPTDSSLRMWLAHMHQAAHAYEARVRRDDGSTSPAVKILLSLGSAFDMTACGDDFRAWNKVINALTAARIGEMPTVGALAFALHPSTAGHFEVATGALSCLHCLAAVCGGAVASDLSVVSRVLLAAAFMPDVSNLTPAHAWCDAAAPHLMPVACSLSRVAATSGYAIVDSGLHPSAFSTICGGLNFGCEGAASSFFTGLYAAEPSEATTLPALIALCDNNCGAVIVCTSKDLAWSCATTGSYFALLFVPEGGVLYYDPASGFKGPFASTDADALQGTRLFTSASRVFLRFARATSDERNASRERLHAWVTAALAPLVSLATAAD